MREEGLPDIYREHSDGEGEKCTKASRLQRKGRGGDVMSFSSTHTLAAATMFS